MCTAVKGKTICNTVALHYNACQGPSYFQTLSLSLVSCVESKDDQERMLLRVNEFATGHKLKWGAEKCMVLKIGKHEDEQNEWSLGELKIKETETYRYLGDVISKDGKNEKNIEAKKKSHSLGCLNQHNSVQ